MAIYENVTDHCPECGAFLNRGYEVRIESGQTVDYTICQGDPSHTWKILDLYRDRSVYHYRLMGPVELPSP